MAATADLENGGGHPPLRLLNSAGVLLCVYRVSSKSGHKCPIYILKTIFKMAAAAILNLMIYDLWLKTHKYRYALHTQLKFGVDIYLIDWDINCFVFV